ncbi:hypothetical protein RJT34_30184 [Clitoria ternatea]|uniref:Uncharacterized protein n=1 Tax=Clitoria ternatea TaxID=43366 RepID=A0AAN9ESY2_CLITE
MYFDCLWLSPWPCYKISISTIVESHKGLTFIGSSSDLAFLQLEIWLEKLKKVTIFSIVELGLEGKVKKKKTLLCSHLENPI